MSKTKRLILTYRQKAELKEVDDTQAKWQKSHTSGKKLTPFVKNKGHAWKYTRSGFNHNYANTGFGARTGINNANRSMKKGLRQLYKKQIAEELNNSK